MRSNAELSPIETLGKAIVSYNECYITPPNRIRTQRKERVLDDLLTAERDSLAARFWSKVDQRGDGCWRWLASTSGQLAHGQFTIRVDGKQYHFYAHRIAWFLTHGAPAGSWRVCHRCDVPACCNPAHLFLGTDAENLNDARRKGRLVCGAHLIKLSDADMRAIRARYLAGRNGKALAAEFGVSLTYLLKVVAGTTPRQLRVLEPDVPVCGALILHGSDCKAVEAQQQNPVLG